MKNRYRAWGVLLNGKNKCCVMYSDKDLDLAVKKKIFKAKDVANFRACITQNSFIDEENFKLITSFNDIFVTVASILVLFSVTSIFGLVRSYLGANALALTSWLLSEVFTRKKRMAFPSIFLSITFTIGVAMSFFILQVPYDNIFPVETIIRAIDLDYARVIIITAAFTAIAAFIYWRRFHTPITISIIVTAIFITIGAILFYIIPEVVHWVKVMMFCAGLLTFTLAMYWDLKDPRRIYINSDVAFWLHLLAAPLIMYPLFNYIIHFNEQIEISQSVTIIVLYVIISIISLVIDRRSLMFASLFYMIYVMNDLFKKFDVIELDNSIAAFVIGFSLLLLSAFWKESRSLFMKILPTSFQKKLP